MLQEILTASRLKSKGPSVVWSEESVVDFLRREFIAARDESLRCAQIIGRLNETPEEKRGQGWTRREAELQQRGIRATERLQQFTTCLDALSPQSLDEGGGH